MKMMEENPGWNPKHGQSRKTELANQIERLEREILKSVPYDNWSAGDGSSAPRAKRESS